MAKKRRFKCDKCPNKKFTNAMDLSAHFKKNKSHRNHKQQIQWEYSQKVQAEKAEGILPTVQRRPAKRRAAHKFCTHCGVPTKPSHNFCGGCGTKL